LVQGGGLSEAEAEHLLKQGLPVAREHAHELSSHLRKFVEWEDHILHGDIGEALLDEYRKFVEQLPTYPSGASAWGWTPLEEVEKRRADPTLTPFCLFTAYFANVYFGLRQCVEIDSLRLAIDRCPDQSHKQWMLGALIAAMSKLGTTYAGHFAQPLVKDPQDLTVRKLSGILERRAASITHEFSIRLLSLARESEQASRPIEVIRGPWQDALVTLDRMLGTEPVAVYVDAPYKREEYGRYYHVLETLVSYAYPSCVGRGKIPDKQKGERFRSEFFTKSKEKVTAALVRVLSEVLGRDWMCIWSYSDSGNANIVDVVEQVVSTVKCEVRSYATPYEHKPQGGRRKKEVTEYLILFVPA